MSTLIIRKRSLKTWVHTDSVLGDFIISKFYFNADNVSFQIVEQGQSRRVIYNVTDITLYNTINGGSAETFTTITALSLRLEQLNYPAFQLDGQITSIANLLEGGDGVEITGDGTEASPYIINLASGDALFLGSYNSLVALQTAYPVALNGSYAFVNQTGADIVYFFSTDENNWWTVSSGVPTLNEVLTENNQTNGKNIFLNDEDSIELENTSSLKKGTYNFGGNGGISRICSNNYEDMWQNGFRHVFDQSGFIRNSSNGFDTVPNSSFDVTLRFKVGSFWTLDNGTTYICTDNTEGAAVWQIYSVGATPTLQEVTEAGNETTLNISVKNSENKTTLQQNGINFQDLDDGGNTILRFEQTPTSDQEVIIRGLGGTMALTSDIPTNTSDLTNDGEDGVNPFITAFDATLQNAYDNSTNGIIILDATRGNIKVKSIAGLTKFMSFFDNLDNEIITFHCESSANAKRISANNNGFFVDSGSNIQGNNLTITDIYSTGDIYLNNDKSLISYLNPAISHYFKGTGGVKWESDVKIEYAADYSALYTNRSLVDKEYVDSLIPGGGGVPYTGATQNVDLGEFELKAGQVTLDTTPTGTAAVATTRWNDTLGSTETTLKGGSVILKNGVDLVARIVNKVTPNTTLTKAAYQVVKVTGAQGQRLAVDLARANSDLNSADTLGIVTETIATNQEGFILTVGQIEEINTTGSLQSETWADGDVLYLSPTTAGAITNIKPNGSNGHIVVLGYVEYAHAIHGKIYVKIMNGWELDELHNVFIDTPLNNQALTYETSTQLWKNKTIIEDSITNGVTAIAPSQNAVFDALALKQAVLSYTPYRNVQTSQTAVTGTTAETIVFTATIPANSFNSSDIIKVLYGANKTTATSTYTLRLRINTTNTIVGATTIAIYNATATAQMNIMTRTFNLNGGNLYGLSGSSSSLTDIIASGTGLASNTLNPANIFYIFATVQLANSGDSIIGNMLSIHN